MTLRLVVASQNPDKVAEVEEILRSSLAGIEIVRGLSWPAIEETEHTLEGNALLKATTVHRHTGLPALADDTGLEVAALGGAPGVHTARYAGDGARYDDNVAKLLRALDGSSDRSARFRSVVALVGARPEPVLVEGVLDGSIADERRGDGGFGYDPVFLVDGRTLAEWGDEVKNDISHRARALRALVDRLDDV